MRPFTLVMSFYDNAGMLEEHFRQWHRLPIEVQQNLHVVIIDDGSPTRPALPVISHAKHWLASFQLWRMQDDIPWNQDACRNIGVREASTDWVLLTDMDHVVHPETWLRLMRDYQHELDKKTVYRFGRVSMPDLSPYKHHPNSWALTRKMFWKIGGYDEALAGNYGTDGDFLNRTRRTASIVDLPEVLIRYPREVIPDASTTTLTRKDPYQKNRINNLIRERSKIANWRPLHFIHPCERVL